MIRNIAVSAVAIAGTVHLAVSFGYYDHTPAQGIFLAAVGLAQIIWAILFRWRATLLLFLFGQILTAGLVILWGLSYLISVPFDAHMSIADGSIWATQSAELIGWFALLGVARYDESIRLHRQPLVMTAVLAFGTCVTGGTLCWVVGTGVEPLFPRLNHMYGQHQFLQPTDHLMALFSTITSLPTANANGSNAASAANTYAWNLPMGFPSPRLPTDNLPTTEKVELGRYLFYDPQLSGNGSQSCSSCHVQALAFSDGKVTPQGSTGEMHLRNSQALINVAYYATLTWANPVLVELEQQILVPLFGESPVEMGVTGHEAEVLARFQRDVAYQARFAAAFPDQPEPVSYHTVVQALASFVRSLVSGNSAYDRYVAGEKAALSPSAQHGMELFFSERFECHHCHTGFNFSVATVHEKSTFSTVSFQNNGLYNLDGAGAYPRGNRGLYEVTGKPTDMGRFRPPTLRNIALTAPYMHDGSMTTLEEVVRHYAAGGRLITDGALAGDGRRNPVKNGLIPGFELSDQEVQALVDFLESLTDEQFRMDPRFADPFTAQPGLQTDQQKRALFSEEK